VLESGDLTIDTYANNEWIAMLPPRSLADAVRVQVNPSSDESGGEPWPPA